jgi:diguanylate cyclase (GGDEF)-like protein/PAS domain S-box-containing protein
MQAIIVNIVILGLLVFVFGVVSRERTDARIQWWVAAWVFVLAHYASNLLNSSNPFGQEVQASLSISTLLLGAICFVLSNVVVHETRRVTLGFAVAMMTMAMVCLNLVIFGPAPLWRLYIPFILQHVGIGVALQKNLRNRPRIFYALSTTNALGLLCIIVTLRMRQPEMLISAILTELFACAAIEFWFDRDQDYGIGLITTVIGLATWTMVFPGALLTYHFWPGVSVNPEVWNIPKFCTAFGMILMVLDEDKRAARSFTEEYRLLFETNPHPLWIFDVCSMEILSVNQAALDKHGYAREEFLQLRLPDLIDPSVVTEHIGEIDIAHPKSNHASRHVCKDGTILPMDITAYDIIFKGRPCRFVLAIDVTEREVLHQRLVQQERHDALTGLPNRLFFQERLAESVAHAVEAEETLAIICLKVDRFKRLNDTYGPNIGDRCLKQIAGLLSSRLRSDDILARTSGNEFSIVLCGLRNAAATKRVTDDLMTLFSQALVVGGHNLEISVSIGIAVCPDDESTAVPLWRGAESALRHAQEMGGGRITWLGPELSSVSEQGVELESYMRTQLKDGGFYLVYQPLYGLDGAVHSCEALLRLNHPKYGSVSPARFIPLAEESSLIVPLGDWVMEEVCRQLREWTARGMRLIPVALNVSSLQFIGGGFADHVMSTLRRFEIDPIWISLELTESAAMLDIEDISKQIGHLSAQGIRFSIDDFGTGYSSLSRLYQLPFSMLKIDRSFTQRLCNQDGTESIVRAIIAMAKTFNMQVVAEGVEFEEQIASLRELNCDYLQGFLLSRPVEPKFIPSLVKTIHPILSLDRSLGSQIPDAGSNQAMCAVSDIRHSVTP